MNINIIERPFILKRGTARRYLFAGRKSNIKNVCKTERFDNNTSGHIINLFELGKRYSVGLKNGRKALACMYVNPYDNSVRITYSIGSAKDFMLKDVKVDGLSQEDKNALYEILKAIGLAETETNDNRLNTLESCVLRFNMAAGS